MDYEWTLAITMEHGRGNLVTHWHADNVRWTMMIRAMRSILHDVECRNVALYHRGVCVWRSDLMMERTFAI